MADDFTPNYGWTKPENGASSDTWGTKWNDNADDIDADLKAVSVVANDAQAGATGSLKIANKLSELSTVAADARTNIGAQPSHALLTALAGLGAGYSSTLRLPYFTSASAMSLATLSGLAASLIAESTSAGMRNQLGIPLVTNTGVYVQASDPGGADGTVWMW